MDNPIHDLAISYAERTGKLLGVIGVLLKYDNSGLNDFTFKQLATTYIECTTDQFDIDAVRAQADKRGVDLT